MNDPLEIGPLQMQFRDKSVVFHFADPMSMTLEIPPTFEEQLHDAVDAHQHQIENRTIIMDLNNYPAISSRQLGMILTVREVLKPYGRLQLINLSSSVQHLLKLTGTDRFFDV